jgi:hypothetical protein
MDLEPEPHPTVINQPRTRHIPPRYDIFTLSTNEPLTQLQRPPSPLPPQVSSPLPSPRPSRVCSTLFETSPDKWGLFQRYRELPSRFCDETTHKDFGCDAPTFANVQAGMAEHNNNPSVLISEGDASPTTEPTMLRFRPLTIFKFFPSLPSHILRLLSMQDQVVERPEQL